MYGLAVDILCNSSRDRSIILNALIESGFTKNQVNKIFGPIGIKLGGRSAPEIALSIIAQLVSVTYSK